jgi:hypothetical protein
MRLYNPYTTASGIGKRGNGETWWTNERDVWTSGYVEKVNEGQITMFPFDIPDDLSIADTHAQYYQLDLEDEEVIVWYSMYSGDTGHYYNVNRKDGRNQYYIYSKGSVTYTGAGHSKIGNSEDELRLFINTIIMTIGAANSAPKITVTNGAVSEGGFYTIYADAVDNYVIRFKATDADLTTLSATDGTYEELGRYKSGQVVWDADRDGVIDPEDVVLETYGELSATGKVLYNDVEVTLNDIMNNPNITESNRIEIRRQMLTNKDINFIIKVTDSKNATATTRVKIATKPLFEID